MRNKRETILIALAIVLIVLIYYALAGPLDAWRVDPFGE